MAATIKERVTAEPACSPAAAAVLTNKPAPMMAPIPRAIRLPAPNVRLSPFSESPAWDMRESKDFFRNKLMLSRFDKFCARKRARLMNNLCVTIQGRKINKYLILGLQFLPPGGFLGLKFLPSQDFSIFCILKLGVNMRKISLTSWIMIAMVTGVVVGLWVHYSGSAQQIDAFS